VKSKKEELTGRAETLSGSIDLQLWTLNSGRFQ
jgi:hypothetical protein